MNEDLNIKVKSREDHIQHFIERVYERYDIDISSKSMDELVERFVGKYKLTESKTLGFVEYGTIKIWALYISYHKCLVTAYPPSLDKDAEGLIRIINTIPMRPLALKLYNDFLFESAFIKPIIKAKALNNWSMKDIANYVYGICYFPTIHLEEYRTGEINLFRLIKKIHNIIATKDGDVTITLKRINRE